MLSEEGARHYGGEAAVKRYQKVEKEDPSGNPTTLTDFIDVTLGLEFWKGGPRT